MFDMTQAKKLIQEYLNISLMATEVYNADRAQKQTPTLGSYLNRKRWWNNTYQHSTYHQIGPNKPKLKGRE